MGWCNLDLSYIRSPDGNKIVISTLLNHCVVAEIQTNIYKVLLETNNINNKTTQTVDIILFCFPHYKWSRYNKAGAAKSCSEMFPFPQIWRWRNTILTHFEKILMFHNNKTIGKKLSRYLICKKKNILLNEATTSNITNMNQHYLFFFMCRKENCTNNVCFIRFVSVLFICDPSGSC